MKTVIGVDSSTQSTKVEVRELESGTVLCTGRGAHPATTPPCSEQDPLTWWQALREALAEARAASSEALANAVAVSIAGQQHGLVVLDESGSVLRPAKLWNDTESAPQAAQLVDRLGAQAWAEAIGTVPVASFTITKLAWLAQREADVFARVRRALLPHDWITYRLTGHCVTDRGEASGSGWWSAPKGEPRFDLLDLIAERDWASMTPTVLGPTEAAGELTSSAAAELGLPAGIVVGPGTGDNMGAALGLGLRTGDVVVSLGTSGTAYTRSPVPTSDPSGSVAGFADATGQWLPLVCTLNATKVTDTAARLLGVDHAELTRLALAAECGAGGLTVVPYFDGERTPNRPNATGLIGGMRSTTTREQFARAAHEGVVSGLLEGVDALRTAGVQLDGRCFLIGGGARSVAYRRALADLSGRTLQLPIEDEVVAAGACVQAAMVIEGATSEVVSERWGLGRGESLAPGSGVDSETVRAAYRSLAHGWSAQ